MPDLSDAFVSGPPPGAVPPECPIERDGLPAQLGDLLGPRFSLVSLCAKRPDLDTSDLPVPLARFWIAPTRNALANAWDRSGRLFPLYGALPAAHYLIRPDGRVLARWHALDLERVRAAVDAAAASLRTG
ncbi:MAG: hypothetical protein ACKVQQ_15405 [Burkholderiales bacterium]